MARHFLTLVLATFFSSALFAQEGIVLKKPDGAKPKDHISYTIGWNVGQGLLGEGLLPGDMTSDDFLAGVLDALAKGNSKIETSEMETAMRSLRDRMVKRVDEIAKNNADKAAKFLEENKTKDGVQSLPSGLQYKVIKSGNGSKPTLNSQVKVHYEGKLLDGSVFDSSIQRGTPIDIKLTQVIPGWTEGLQRMKVGDKWQLYIPPDLGYRAQGSPPRIGPNELLIFDVELIDVK